VSNQILHLHDEPVEPMLDARDDITWERGGFRIGVVEYGDFESCRMIAQQAIYALAVLTQKLERADAVILALREENRALRLRLAA